MPINVTRSSLPSLEEYVEEIRPIFESYYLTNMGPIYKKLKQQLKDYLGVQELSVFTNGHLALETAIHALKLRCEGGEVITTPFTFVSTTHAIVRNGLKPVFCDIRESDYTMDPERIEELITDKTVAILPVHVYGNICDVDAISAIARRHGLKVIYDGAHAFGEKADGVGVGNFGDATMFSFHATKVFNTVEGGAVAFQNREYAKALHELKNFGIYDGEDADAVGGNAKMDEFRAAMGVCNLRHIEEAIAARKAVYDRYFERLSGVPGIVLNPVREGVQSNYAYFPVRFDPQAFGKSRDEALEQLRRQEINARRYFYPAVNDMTCYRALEGAPTPIAHAVSQQILCLPIYEGLSVAQADRICDVVLN